MTSIGKQSSILQRCWEATERVLLKTPFSLKIEDQLKASIQKIVKAVEEVELGSGHCISFKFTEGNTLYSCRVICRGRVESTEEHSTSDEGRQLVYDEKRSFLRCKSKSTDWERRKLVTAYPSEVLLMRMIFGGNEASLGVVGYNIPSLERFTRTQNGRPFQSFYDVFLYSREELYSPRNLPQVRKIKTESRTIMYFPSCKYANGLGFFLTQIRKVPVGEEKKIRARGIVWDEKNQCIDESKLESVQPDSYTEIFCGKKPQVFAQFPVYNEGYFEAAIVGYLVENKSSTLFSMESLFVYLLQRFSGTVFPRPSLWGKKNASEKVENGKTTIVFKNIRNGDKKVSIKACVEPFVGSKDPIRGLCWDSEKTCIKAFEWKTEGLTLLRFYAGKYLITVKSQQSFAAPSF